MSARMDKEQHRLYIAYGSNMDEEQMKARCSESELVGLSRLDGYRFLLNSRGVATIVSVEGKSVHGVVWSISEGDEAKLDRYEGVKSGLYRKEQVQVTLADGDRAEALVYVAADGSDGKFWGEYLNRIIKAAKRHGLPAAHIKELERQKKNKQRVYSEEEEAYLARLMAGRTHGLARTRAEWYLNNMQTWTSEDYDEYTRVNLEMLDFDEDDERMKTKLKKLRDAFAGDG